MSLEQFSETRGPKAQQPIRSRHGARTSRQLLGTPQVITGTQFRQLLGWGKDRFRDAVDAGRFSGLISINASSPARVVYVRAKVEAWIAQAPDALRASRPHGAR